ncbi:MAG: hypothetical protein KGI98_12020 [Euryarchaeota archaeon]|nr:hypothetical protein [Euryarchaeota archaeon]
MDRFDRVHLDGVGDGLSIALGLAKKARSAMDATRAIERVLLNARAAKDRDTVITLEELASDRAHDRA